MQTGKCLSFTEKHILFHLGLLREREQEMTIQETRADRESAVTLASVRFEHSREAFGLGTARPRLSGISKTTSAG
jgi:hypothetical protein